MLPVNVDGVVWLTTNMTEYCSSLWFFLAICIGCVGAVLILSGLFTFIVDDMLLAGPQLIIGVCLFGLMMASIKYDNACEAKFTPKPVSYTVYFTEDVDYKKLYENYNIIDEQDNLITIELKEN